MDELGSDEVERARVGPDPADLQRDGVFQTFLKIERGADAFPRDQEDRSGEAQSLGDSPKKDCRDPRISTLKRTRVRTGRDRFRAATGVSIIGVLRMLAVDEDEREIEGPVDGPQQDGPEIHQFVVFEFLRPKQGQARHHRSDPVEGEEEFCHGSLRSKPRATAAPGRALSHGTGVALEVIE